MTASVSNIFADDKLSSTKSGYKATLERKEKNGTPWTPPTQEEIDALPWRSRRKALGIGLD